MIEGFDISRHQGSIDLRRAAREGYAFVIVKATEGIGYLDPLFDRNVRAAKDAGLVIGAYHFARPSSLGTVEDATAEARALCVAIRNAGGLESFALPPAIDFEEYSKNTPAENELWLLEFERVVESELGTSPMICTGSNVWRFEAANSTRFDHLPLWLMRYSARSIVPKLEGFGAPDIWQWSGGSKFAFGPLVAGVRCDLNRYVGSDWVDLVTPRIRRAA